MSRVSLRARTELHTLRDEKLQVLDLGLARIEFDCLASAIPGGRPSVRLTGQPFSLAGRLLRWPQTAISERFRGLEKPGVVFRCALPRSGLNRGAQQNSNPLSEWPTCSERDDASFNPFRGVYGE